jgi:hypothetical protein
MRVEDGLSIYSPLSSFYVRPQQPATSRNVQAVEPVTARPRNASDSLDISPEGLALSQNAGAQTQSAQPVPMQSLTYSAPAGYCANLKR